MVNPESKYTTCEGCGQRIDPDWCWCGSKISDHTQSENHSAVPMGCTCYKNNEAIPWETEDCFAVDHIKLKLVITKDSVQFESIEKEEN